MTAKLSKLNQSVEKVLQIIEIMAHERQPMRLQDVAAGCGMPASTVLRMLNTLLVYGYVNQDPHSLRYSLSLKFAQIGSRVCEQVSLRDIAHPLLAELSRECREASCLAIEEDMEVVYTDVVDGPDSMLKIMQRIGKRAPMHSTGIGKLLLLNYSEEQLDEYIAAKGLPALTPNTLVTKQALRQGKPQRLAFPLQSGQEPFGLRLPVDGVQVRKYHPCPRTCVGGGFVTGSR